MEREKQMVIPKDLQNLYDFAILRPEHAIVMMRPSLVQNLIERIGFLEAEVSESETVITSLVDMFEAALQKKHKAKGA